MVDGDPQQKSELFKALLDSMPNAVNGGCGWHIAEQGWKRHGPAMSSITVAGGKRDKFNLFRKHVKDWCYSWMTADGVESEDEYTVSKQSLFAYLASPEVFDTCDSQQHLLDQVSKFIRNYVSPIDHEFTVNFCGLLANVISLQYSSAT